MLNSNQLLVMLAIQRRPKDAYGVTIQEEIKGADGKSMSFGVLYNVLVRLESDGLVRGRTGEATPERGGKAKRYYSLTGKGIRSLEESLAALDRLRAEPAVAFAGLS